MFQTQFQQMMRQIMNDPINLGKEKGYDIPANLANDPQAIVNHLINTNQVNQQLMQRIAPLMRMMGK